MVADSLAPDAVRPLLSGRFGEIYRYEERCPSTQRLLQADDPEGAVAVAEEQSEGRGRLGRSWHAPAGTSVLVSIALRPAVESPRLPELSLIAGGAVAEAIAGVTGLEPAIKFPNDVLLDGKKVAGILAESSDGRVVLGIGVTQTRPPSSCRRMRRRSRHRCASSSAGPSSAPSCSLRSCSRSSAPTTPGFATPLDGVA